jgi:hypothetical protein
MTTRSCFRSSLTVGAVLVGACPDDSDLPRDYVELDAGYDGGVIDTAVVLPPGCAPFGSPLPKTLSCTGLYGEAGAGPLAKIVPLGNREFTPGAVLWSDGDDKRRWIALPPGTQIDTSDPNGWVFPNGTRLWKEFAFQGKRIETRLMYKADGVWAFAAYQWNDTDTEATAVDGAEVSLPGGRSHTIPTNMQCNECHRGSRDKVLGFQHVLLGLPSAKGYDLTTLVAEQRLSVPPARTSHVIPDDGTGRAAEALSWLHVNCGVSCHNETGNAGANMSKMFLRIDPRTLEAATPADWNIIKMTVGVPSMTANFFGGLRIVPGQPEQSLLVQLAETRGSNQAMPPIATRTVDPVGIANLRAWITHLGQHDLDAGLDAGLDASSADAGEDASSEDASTHDAGVPEEASIPEVMDSGAVDADVVD